MRRIYAFYFYRVCAPIHDLLLMQTGIKATPDVIEVLVLGADTLKRFRTEVDPVRLRSSIAAAEQLEKVVRTCLQTIANNAAHQKVTSIISQKTEKAAKAALTHFESMLEKELHDFPLFSVEEKGNLSLERLLDGASHGYPTEVIAKLTPKIINEIDESGKCLAFARSTASAFHILRSLELLIAKYIGALGRPMAPPNRCNWGEYISILRTGGAPKETTDLLQIVKDNYRNPIMHPDATLTEPEALSLFGLCQSAIEIIARHLP